MAEIEKGQVEKFTSGLNFPTNKQNLIKHAEQQGADQHVRQVLLQLPEQTYQNENDLTRAIGEIGEPSQQR